MRGPRPKDDPRFTFHGSWGGRERCTWSRIVRRSRKVNVGQAPWINQRPQEAALGMLNDECGMVREGG